MGCGDHVVMSRMVGLRSENFDYRMDAVPDFNVQPHAPPISKNMANSVGPIFTSVITSSTWCPTSSWADAILTTSNTAVQGSDVGAAGVTKRQALTVEDVASCECPNVFTLLGLHLGSPSANCATIVNFTPHKGSCDTMHCAQILLSGSLGKVQLPFTVANITRKGTLLGCGIHEFNHKTDDYNRPTNSNQHTQHNVLWGRSQHNSSGERHLDSGIANPEVKSEQDSNAVVLSLVANLAVWKATVTTNSLNAPSLSRDVADIWRGQDLVLAAMFSLTNLTLQWTTWHAACSTKNVTSS
ncbi:hypothetical protein TSMEX_007189 [Taenia solium]|eukprot:TsM_000137700 transcript=TsM_000137700 gene=TsM_000137700